MEDIEKGIKFKLEVKEKGKINFLDTEIRKGKKNEKIRKRWFRKTKILEYIAIGGVMWTKVRKIM